MVVLYGIFLTMSMLCLFFVITDAIELVCILPHENFPEKTILTYLSHLESGVF